jgi:hypothetical protein
VIAKAFILAKDPNRISAKILPDNKIIHDHDTFPVAFAERRRPMLPKRRWLPICGLGAEVVRPGAPIRAIAGEARCRASAGKQAHGARDPGPGGKVPEALSVHRSACPDRPGFHQFKFRPRICTRV